MTCLEHFEKMRQAMIKMAEAIGNALLRFFESVHDIFKQFVDLLPRCRFCGCILVLTVTYTCDRCSGPSRFWEPWMAVRAP